MEGHPALFHHLDVVEGQPGGFFARLLMPVKMTEGNGIIVIIPGNIYTVKNR